MCEIPEKGIDISGVRGEVEWKNMYTPNMYTILLSEIQYKDDLSYTSYKWVCFVKQQRI
jgi:hypothetical protein